MAIGIVGWQCFEWLRDAVWYPMPISYAVSAPITRFAGFNLILNWLADIHISIALAVIGGLIFAWGLGIRETARGWRGTREEQFEETIGRIKQKLSRD